MSRRCHLAMGSWANAVRTSLCNQVLKCVLKTSITAHPFSSTVALMDDSSTSVCVLEGLHQAWFDGFAVSVGVDFVDQSFCPAHNLGGSFPPLTAMAGPSLSLLPTGFLSFTH